MQFYNTMSRKKETFTPVRKGLVGVYACGITAYALSHIGHARSAVAFDILVRLLRYKGYEVTFVRNFTDVDDKIIKRANDEGVSSTEIAETYIKAYHEDMDRLGVMPRRHRAQGHRAHSGNARPSPSAWSPTARPTPRLPATCISARAPSPATASCPAARPTTCVPARASCPATKRKTRWTSPSGRAPSPANPTGKARGARARPGWHIECSAMTKKYLGETDRHPLRRAGPASSPTTKTKSPRPRPRTASPSPTTGCTTASCSVDSEKMSKSLGNFKTIRDILESYLAETLRYFLAGKHYRSPIDFSLDNMDESERSQKRVYECLREVDKALARENWKPGAAPAELVEELKQQDQSFMDALEDDVNTAAAMGHLFNMVRIAGRVLEDKKLRNSEGGRDILRAFRDATAKWDTLLGLFAQKPEGFLAPLREIRARRRGLDMNKVAGLLRERQEARAAKDFARSDAARDELAALGVEVRDTPEGPVWDII